MSLLGELLDLDLIDAELYASFLECECGERYRLETGGWLASGRGAYQEREFCPVCGRKLAAMLANAIAILSAGDITPVLLHGINEAKLPRYGKAGEEELARREEEESYRRENDQRYEEFYRQYYKERGY